MDERSTKRMSKLVRGPGDTRVDRATILRARDMYQPTEPRINSRSATYFNQPKYVRINLEGFLVDARW